MLTELTVKPVPRYRRATIRSSKAGLDQVVSSLMSIPPSVTGHRATTHSVADAWSTEQLVEVRAPLAAKRMRREALSKREQELLTFLDAELDRRFHGPPKPSELGVLLEELTRRRRG